MGEGQGVEDSILWVWNVIRVRCAHAQYMNTTANTAPGLQRRRLLQSKRVCLHHPLLHNPPSAENSACSPPPVLHQHQPPATPAATPPDQTRRPLSASAPSTATRPRSVGQELKRWRREEPKGEVRDPATRRRGIIRHNRGTGTRAGEGNGKMGNAKYERGDDTRRVY